MFLCILVTFALSFIFYNFNISFFLPLCEEDNNCGNCVKTVLFHFIRFVWRCFCGACRADTSLPSQPLCEVKIVYRDLSNLLSVTFCRGLTCSCPSWKISIISNGQLAGDFYNFDIDTVMNL